MSNAFAGKTIDAARRHLGKLLRDESIETPELDARLLIGAVLGLDLTGLATSPDRLIDERHAMELAALAERRMRGEPVARIIGVKEFWGLPFRLSPATLVPRPDTETIVEASLDVVGKQRTGRVLRIADLGTGSGAILLALLSELPNAWGVGTDIDVAALGIAADNAERFGLANCASFVRGSYAQTLNGSFDLIVSNPPYIPTHDIAALDVEVRDHDPHRALDGGLDGLDAYRAIIPQASGLLREGGALLVEVGQNQSRDVARLMEYEGLTLAPVKFDLAQIPRVVIGRK